MKEKIFAVLGGDLRQIYLARGLSDRGYTVRLFGFDDYPDRVDGAVTCVRLENALEHADYVILPIPYSSDGELLNAPYSTQRIALEDIYAHLTREMTVFGGKFCNMDLTRQGIKTIDYFEREELQVLNAVPTAEGAIDCAMRESPYTLASSKCLVVGYGRIGKALAPLLKGLNADVSVSARKYSDLAWISAMGYTPCRTEEAAAIVGDYDIVFNTVPAPVIGRSVLENAKKGALFIDLASKPGGIDFTAAKALGVHALRALSLPGKTSPATAGNIIMQTVLNIIGQEN